MTPLLPLLIVAPVKLEIAIPQEVRPGQPVEVVVSIRNTSTRPVTIAKPTPPNNRIGINWNTKLVFDGEELLRDEQSEWRAQWMIGWKIRPTDFIQIQPGQSVAVYRDKFSDYYLSGKLPSTKPEVEKEPKSSLTPGRYTFKVAFAFDRGFEKWKLAEAKRNPGHPETKMEGPALTAYNTAWTGALEAEATFEVKP